MAGRVRCRGPKLNAPDRARSYIGVPFLHQGRNPAVGIDCIGLLALVFPEHAGHPENRADYGRNPHAGLLEQRMRVIFGEPVGDMRPGDVVALKYAGPIRHVGVLGHGAHGLTLIHTDAARGKVVEHHLDDKWARRIALVFRPEIAE